MCKKVLVITAECGESQFEKQKRLLKKQRGVSLQHLIISNKPSLEAEALIYSESLAAKHKFDWVLKLDADMLPVNEHSVLSLVECAERLSVRGRLTTSVLDFFAGKQITGVHLINPLFVPSIRIVKKYKPDSWISELPGVSLTNVEDPQILHAFEPNTHQSVRYGLHRGMKSLVEGPRCGNWRNLNYLRLNLIRNSDDIQLHYAYYGFFVGLGIFNNIDSQWNNVDFNSSANYTVVKFIQNMTKTRPEQIKVFMKLQFILKTHLETYKSFYETFRFFIKTIYYNIQPRLPSVFKKQVRISNNQSLLLGERSASNKKQIRLRNV